ncbi:MAG: adenosine deaminase, partial [Treponema sp.]|nr:adenosine deaminase [Treponema sp.]
MNKKEFYSFFKSVPKAEIHIHLEAVMSRDTIKALYLKKNGVEFTEEEMEQWFSYDNLNGFIQTFLKVQELFTSVDDFDLVFYDLKK